MRRSITTLCLIGILLGNSAAADDSKEITALIAEVERAEKLFQNFDMTVVVDFELLREGAPTSIKRTRRVRRHVEQEGEIYFSESLTGATVDARPITQDNSAGYDGKRTWVWRSGNVSNYVGSIAINDRQYPHTLLLTTDFLKGDRLSQWLSSKTSRSSGTVMLTFEGEEAVGDLACVRLKRVIRFPGAIPSEERWIWLAKDRNYMPVKMTVTNGSTSAFEETRVTSWIDVRPGVWCPRQCETIVDRIDPKTMRISKNHRETLEVTEFESSPANDPSLFSTPSKPVIP